VAESINVTSTLGHFLILGQLETAYKYCKKYFRLELVKILFLKIAAGLVCCIKSIVAVHLALAGSMIRTTLRMLIRR
jgi:hypothetical protein